jgi:hypothetical protein
MSEPIFSVLNGKTTVYLWNGDAPGTFPLQPYGSSCPPGCATYTEAFGYSSLEECMEFNPAGGSQEYSEQLCQSCWDGSFYCDENGSTRW